MFGSAVTRGELVVFGKIVDLSMINPSRVEYVFDLVNNMRTVRVYSDLITPLRTPDLDNCKVYGISAEISLDGHIVGTEAHVWPE